MATLNSVMTKMQNLLSSLCTKMGTTYTTFTAAINALPSKADRAQTTITATANAAKDMITITATNPQTSGIVTADTLKDTSVATVIQSVDGNKVYAWVGDGQAPIEKSVATGSAATPPTTITANPSLSTTYTSGSGYKMSVSKTQSVTPTVNAGYVNSGTAGTITVSGSAYVPQSSTGDATTSTTDTATRTIGYGQQTTIGAGYYPSARIIRNSVSSVGRAKTILTSAKSNNTLVFTANNPQTTGYVTADTSKDTATKTVSLSVSGGTVTASDGTNSIAKTVATGSATTPPTTITKNPTIVVDNSGLITASYSGIQSVTPTVSAGYVSSGTAGTITVSGSATKQLTLRTKNDLTSSNLTVYAPAGYYPSQVGKTLNDSNLVAGNIKKSVSIFGVTGTYEGSGGASIATCTVNISSSISINNSDFIVGATTFQNGKISTFAASGVNYNISITNVVCGSTIFLSVGTMSSIYGWSGGYSSSWNTESHVLYVPNTTGTYSAEIGVVDD